MTTRAEIEAALAAITPTTSRVVTRVDEEQGGICYEVVLYRGRDDVPETVHFHDRDVARARQEALLYRFAPAWLRHLLAEVERLDVDLRDVLGGDTYDVLVERTAELAGCKAEIAGWVAWQNDHIAVERDLQAELERLRADHMSVVGQYSKRIGDDEDVIASLRSLLSEVIEVESGDYLRAFDRAADRAALHSRIRAALAGTEG